MSSVPGEGGYEGFGGGGGTGEEARTHTCEKHKRGRRRRTHATIRGHASMRGRRDWQPDQANARGPQWGPHAKRPSALPGNALQALGPTKRAPFAWPWVAGPLAAFDAVQLGHPRGPPTGARSVLQTCVAKRLLSTMSRPKPTNGHGQARRDACTQITRPKPAFLQARRKPWGSGALITTRLLHHPFSLARVSMMPGTCLC